jgi:hypothetical protein
MNCRDFLDRYSDYDDSLLDPAERELFAGHLRECPRCERYDRVLRKGRMLARQLPPSQPTPDFVPRLHQRLHQLRHERRRRSYAAIPGGAAGALAAVTVLLTVSWVVLLMERSPAGGVAVESAPREESEVERASRWAVDDAPASLSAARHGQERPAGGRVVLPAADVPRPQGWSTGRVDHYVPVAYSPLVTGPPAYRVAATFNMSASTSTLHPPD